MDINLNPDINIPGCNHQHIVNQPSDVDLNLIVEFNMSADSKSNVEFNTNVDLKSNTDSDPSSYSDLSQEHPVYSQPAFRFRDIRFRHITWLLYAWMILPFVMAFHFMFMGLFGLLPDTEQLEYYGYSLGGCNYLIEISSYQFVFHVLGIITIVFAILILINSLKRILKKDNLKNRIWIYLFGALLVWAVISALFSDNLYNAFVGSSYMGDGLSSYFIYAAVFICATAVVKEKSKLGLIRAFCCMVLFQALIVILQTCGADFLIYAFPSARAGVFNQFNHFGYMLCMAVLAFTGLLYYDGATRTRRILYIIGLIVTVYMLLLNDTFGAYLAALAALPIALVFYKKSGRRLTWIHFLPIAIFVVMTILSVLGLLPGIDGLLSNFSTFGSDLKKILSGSDDAKSAGTGRMILWLETLERIGERPIFGFGPEGLYGKHALYLSQTTHNEYLEMAGYLGIPALLLYLGALVTLCIHHFKRIKKLEPMVLAASGITLVYLFSSAFGNPLFNTYPYLWIFLGLMSVGSHEEPLMVCEDPVKEQRPGWKHYVIVLGGAAVFIALGTAAIIFSYKKTEEAGKEESDLMLMDVAEYVAEEAADNDELEIGKTYYLNSYIYIITEEKPHGYGLGTELDGDGLTAYFEADDSDEVVGSDSLTEVLSGVAADGEEVNTGSGENAETETRAAEDYNYDETVDYTNKVVRILYDGQDVQIDWVE